MIKKLLLSIILLTISYAQEGKIDMHGGKEVKKAPIFYGKVLEIKQVMGYKYLKVDENGKQVWVAIANAPVKVGDRIGYDKRTIMKDFTSKTLQQSFKEVIFASDVYLPQKAKKFHSMRDMLGLSRSAKKEKPTPSTQTIPTKPFVKKEFYTVEEVFMYRKSLKGEIVQIKGSIYKVSRDIMKRDWVHIGDGTGEEKKLTDDLVFTAKNTHLKANDKVIARGKVILDKDFGYGYFYPVLIENASFVKIP